MWKIHPISREQHYQGLCPELPKRRESQQSAKHEYINSLCAFDLGYDKLLLGSPPYFPYKDGL